jgi:hypothetical protein
MNIDIEQIKSKFATFKGFIELGNFRTFLLRTLSEDSGENPISRFLEGMKTNRQIFYDTEKKAVIREQIISDEATIVEYFKCEPPMDKQVISTDDTEFFNKHLSKFEQETMIEPKLKINLIKYINKAFEVNQKYNKVPKFEITKIYNDLSSFLLGNSSNSMFYVLDGAKQEPDILFCLPINITSFIKNSYNSIHVFVDKSKICAANSYLRLNVNDFKIEGIKELKDTVTHGDMFNNKFFLLGHVKSFNSI